MAGRRTNIEKAELDGGLDVVDGCVNVLNVPKVPLSGTMPGVNKPGTEGDEMPMLEVDAFQWHLRRVSEGRTVSKSWTGAEREASIEEWKRVNMARYWKRYREWKAELDIRL